MNVKYSLFRPRGLLWFYWTDHIPLSPCLKYLLWLFCPATLVWNYYFNYYLFFDLFAQRDFDVLCFCSPPAVPGLPERCVSHLEKRCQPTGGCHPTRLWEHDVDQRPEELHLQRRWCVFLSTQNKMIFMHCLLKKIVSLRLFFCFE